MIKWPGKQIEEQQVQWRLMYIEQIDSSTQTPPSSTFSYIASFPILASLHRIRDQIQAKALSMTGRAKRIRTFVSKPRPYPIIFFELQAILTAHSKNCPRLDA